ncbi:MAG: glutamate formimidoyltransferase [Rikenellaceae bacterium]
MQTKLLEAVPNFSEGRDKSVIEHICAAIQKHDKVKIISCDMGYDANRTVITIIGEAKAMELAMFDAMKAAAEKIDMSTHTGEHPRIGATDVMPFIPLSGATIDDAISAAHSLAARVAKELSIAVYCYEKAAFSHHKRNLFECRKGEYEGIMQKLQSPEWKPDFGSDKATPQLTKSGISVIGAREFLLAVNFNLTTKDSSIAKLIAQRVRKSGYIKDGKRIEGSLEGAKAIGWYMEKYGFAQVSMNIVDINKTPLHIAFKEVCKVAKEHGTEVTGTEIIGMLPLRVMTEAADYFNNNNSNLTTNQKIELSIQTMNFDQIEPFRYHKESDFYF